MNSVFKSSLFYKFSKFNFLNFNKTFNFIYSNNIGYNQPIDNQEEVITGIECKGRNSKVPKRVYKV